MIDAAEAIRRARERKAAADPAQPPPDAFVTLAQAKAFVENGLADGVDCPCCGQLCKRYARKLYADMAVWLIWLVRRHAELTAQGLSGWVNVTEFALRGGDYGKLQHWGLCDLMPKDPHDSAKRTSGMWRPTELGIEFVFGRVMVASHVVLFNNTVQGWSDELVDIRSTLGTGFNYDDLMHGDIAFTRVRKEGSDG